MTLWELRCEVCGNIRFLDLGFDLTEMKRVYVYCEVCGRNTFHTVLGPRERE